MFQIKKANEKGICDIKSKLSLCKDIQKKLLHDSLYSDSPLVSHDSAIMFINELEQGYENALNSNVWVHSSSGLFDVYGTAALIKMIKVFGKTEALTYFVAYAKNLKLSFGDTWIEEIDSYQGKLVYAQVNTSNLMTNSLSL